MGIYAMGDSGIWGYVMFFFHGGLEGNRYTTSARLYLAFGPGCVWKSWIQPQVLAMLMGKAWWLTNGYTDGLGSTIFRQTQHVDSAWPICCRWRVSVGQDSDIYIYDIWFWYQCRSHLRTHSHSTWRLLQPKVGFEIWRWFGFGNMLVRSGQTVIFWRL